MLLYNFRIKINGTRIEVSRLGTDELSTAIQGCSEKEYGVNVLQLFMSEAVSAPLPLLLPGFGRFCSDKHK